MGANYCDERVCLSVYLRQVYLRNHTAKLHQFLCVFDVAVAWS